MAAVIAYRRPDSSVGIAMSATLAASWHPTASDIPHSAFTPHSALRIHSALRTPHSALRRGASLDSAPPDALTSRAMFRLKPIALIIIVAGGLFTLAHAQEPTDAGLLSEFSWRAVGPVNMGGRIDDVEAVESDPSVIYVGAATGGVWKTTNNGTTWAPVFDAQPNLSIGDIAIAPSNPNVVWAGT